MSDKKDISVTIKFYAQEIFVTLPLDYDKFLNSLIGMLQIEQSQINNFKIFYLNFSDQKNYIIHDHDSYAEFLDSCSKNFAKVINIELSNDDENNYEDNNKNKGNNSDEIMNEIEISSKRIYKNSDEEEELNNNINNINNKNNEEIILNNKDEDNEAIEFSYLSESKNINQEENNININNINKKNKDRKKNFNNLFGENNYINNKINSSPFQDILQKNKIAESFDLTCSLCKQQKFSDIIYYCKDCKIFFCKDCEKNEGKIHKHCYYKIRNKDQYNEINDVNSIGNKLGNINNNLNKSIINNGIILEKSVKEIITQGSKIIGNIGTNLKNFIFNENDNNSNNNNKNNNEIDSNELNNPYKINNIEEQNYNLDISDENQLKQLVEEAKNSFNLSSFSDLEIEKALIENNGNIDKAASMLISNFNL